MGAGLNARARLVALAALLFFGTAWGATVTLAQVAVSSGHAPIAVTAWELAYGLTVLGAVCALRQTPPPVSKAWLVRYGVIALFGSVAPNAFSYWAAFHLTGGVIAIVIAAAPLLTLLVAVALRADRFTIANVSGLALGFAGIALLVLPGEALPDPTKAIFVFVALVGCACYAVETNYVALAIPDETDPIAVLTGAFAVGLAIAVPAALATGRMTLAHAPWNMDGFGPPEWALLALSLFHVVAYGGYLWIVKRTGPVFASQIGTVVTLSGVVLSAWALGERNSPFIWASLVLLVAGMSLVRPRSAPREGPARHEARTGSP